MLFNIAIPPPKIALKHQSKPFITCLVDGPLWTLSPIAPQRKREQNSIITTNLY